MSVDSYKMKYTAHEGVEFEFDLDEDVSVYVNDTKCVPVHAYYLDEDSTPFRISVSGSMFVIEKVERCHYQS